MKNIYFTLFASMLSVTSNAANTAMHLVETSSYSLTALVQKGTVPAYISTDLSAVQINDGPTAKSVVLMSPSNNPADPNSVTIQFSAAGKVIGTQNHIVGQPATAPIFTAVDGAKLLDLAAEAVVDHLTEDANLPTVAATATSILISKQNAAQFAIQLKDGRVYKIVLDLAGNLISKGF
jgi:hypothetical protein